MANDSANIRGCVGMPPVRGCGHSLCRAVFAVLTCLTDAGTCFTGVGGLRGAMRAAEFVAFELCVGCEDLAAVVAGFTTSCGESALGATALRTDTAGPPGQPERLSLRGLSSSWAVVGSAFLAVCWPWV